MLISAALEVEGAGDDWAGPDSLLRTGEGAAELLEIASVFATAEVLESAEEDGVVRGGLSELPNGLGNCEASEEVDAMRTAEVLLMASLDEAASDEAATDEAEDSDTCELAAKVA